MKIAAVTSAAPLSAYAIAYTYDGAGRLTAVSYGGTSNTTYGFDKEGNLLTQADTTNKFAPLARGYGGVVQSSGTVSNATTGFITLKTTPDGTFSGKLSLAGRTFILHGQFDANGDAVPIMISRAVPQAALRLILHLDLTDGTGEITGTFVEAQVTVATTTASAVIYNRKTYPLPAGLAGRFTMLLEPTSNASGIPQGDGYGTLTIDSAGKVRFAGALSNGTKFAAAAPLSPDYTLPLYASLDRAKGSLSGTLAFANLAATDVTGTVTWIKPDTAKGLYRTHFETSLNVAGSSYGVSDTMVRALPLANTVPNASFTATGGGLVPSLTKAVTLDEHNKFTVSVPSADRLALSIKVSNGLVRGSFINSGRRLRFSGVILQKQDLAGGFFLGSSSSGTISIAP